MNIKVTLMQYIKRISDDDLLAIKDLADKEIKRRSKNDAQSIGAITDENNK